jgi:LppP/LprE lipoprotein
MLSAIVLALGASTGALFSGCGSSSKTASVATAPTPSQTTGTTPTQPSTTTTQASTTPSHTTTNGGVPAPGTTRTAPAPAFTRAAGGEGLTSATAILRAKGFTANNTSDYHSNQALRVLVGTHTGSGDGYGQQAFFFVNGRYIGTDSKQPSATLRVLGQSDTEVTLGYPLYRNNDPLCCPGGGQARVRFRLDNGKLTPLDPIPPASSQSGLSRQ